MKKALLLLFFCIVLSIYGSDKKDIIKISGIEYQIEKLKDAIIKPVDGMLEGIGFSGFGENFYKEEIEKIKLVFEKQFNDSLSNECISKIESVFNTNFGKKLLDRYSSNIFEDSGEFNKFKLKIENQELSVRRYSITRELSENAGFYELESLIKTHVIAIMGDVYLAAIHSKDGMKLEEFNNYSKTADYEKMLVFVRRRMVAKNSGILEYDFNKYLYFFSTFSEDELIEYNSFLKSKVGRKFSKCIFEAYNKSLTELNHDIITKLFTAK